MSADINVQLCNGATLVGDANPLPVSFVPAKTASLPLFGGALAASVNEANATVIDMRKYTKGALSALFVSSSTGPFSLAFFGNDVATGVFKQIYQENNAKSGVEAKPPIVTSASTSLMYNVSEILCNYLKIVPTLSGTATYTFAFTPSI